MNLPESKDSGTDPAAQSEAPQSTTTDESEALDNSPADSTVEHGGPKGLEPTRYGDWERKGRCIDF